MEILETFYIGFKDELPTRVWFVDPIGTKIGIILDKFDHTAYFSHGLHNVLRHYQLNDGAWLKLTYLGQMIFAMKVKDLHPVQVDYPTPGIKIDFVIKFRPSDFHDYTTKSASASARKNNSNKSWNIILTHKQVTISNLVIESFCVYSFYACVV